MILPNDIIREIGKLVSSFTRSKLCQINKQYYHVFEQTSKIISYWDIHRDYHSFAINNMYLLPKYLTDGNVDIDVAKLIWNRKKPLLNRCYDVIFNAYRCGNQEYINFIVPEIFKLDTKRQSHWREASIRGAIAGGQIYLINEIATNNQSWYNYFKYAYECGQVEIIELFKQYGYKADEKVIEHAYEKNMVNVIYYEYINNSQHLNIKRVTSFALRKCYLPLIKRLIVDGVKFSEHDLNSFKSRHCHNTELIQLITF